METKVSLKTGLGMGRIFKGLILGQAAMLAVLPAAYAAEYDTAQTGTISAATSCANNSFLERVINVPDAFTVSDLNLGFLMTHNFRGDLELTLRSPSGTDVQLINSNVNAIFQNNYNIELDDQAATLINTAPHDTNDGTAAPPYENLVRPNNVTAATTGLGSFAGEPAAGNWTLRMCDAFPGADDGTFQNAALFFTSPQDADLSLALTASSTAPTIGGTVTLTATVQNDGPQAAASSTATLPLPSGLTFVSASGPGSYDAVTGLWTLPNLPNGSAAVLDIDVSIDPLGSYVWNGEVTTAPPDPDSFAGNGSTDEDDDDSLTLSPVPPSTPPPLTCPAADQAALTWTAPGGSAGWNSTTLSNSYVVGGRNVDITLSGDTGQLIPRGGTPTPVSDDELTSGNGFGIIVYADFVNTSQSVTTTIDLGVPGEGVGEISFDVLDVDLGVWTDRMTITGSLGGVAVGAILTPGGANQVVNGNQIIGTAGSTAPSTAGNANIAFLSQVDQVVIVYDNASPTADPEPQVFSLFHDFTTCPPPQADIGAIKSVEVYDPANVGGLYAIPGQEMLYKITIENSAQATASAQNINVQDTLPETVRFISASTAGFTGGAFGAPALPAANTDCAGGACVISFSGASLPINSIGEVLVVAAVK